MTQRFKFYSYADHNPIGCEQCHAAPITVQIVDYDTNKIIAHWCDTCTDAVYEEHPDSIPGDTMERRRQ